MTFYVRPKDLINKLGDSPLTQYIKVNLGGWPMVMPHWSPVNFDLTELMVQLRRVSVSPVVRLTVDVDMKNSTRHVLTVSELNSTNLS